MMCCLLRVLRWDSFFVAGRVLRPETQGTEKLFALNRRRVNMLLYIQTSNREILNKEITK